MKIIIPTFERIEWMPPTITMLKELNKNGYEVLVITLFPSQYLEELNLDNVSQLSLTSKERSLQKKIRYIKGLSGILYRLDLLYKKIIARKLRSVLRDSYKQGDLLWVVNEMTVILGGASWLKKYKYLFTIYELHELNYRNRNIIKAAQHAENVIVPEYCRAHIMKFWYNLNRVPLIIPNKSDVIFSKDVLDLPNYVQEAIVTVEKLKSKGKFLLVYMGIISRERPLDAILSAIRNHSQYHLVVLGRETEYLHTLERNYRESLTYLGNFLPPYHLQVAQNADAGILVYTPASKNSGLNALFCAPNKIWEYSGLGLPVIANDIPGLKFEVEYSNIGHCVDFTSEVDILKAITRISENCSAYNKASADYYSSKDISAIYRDIISGYNSEIGG